MEQVTRAWFDEVVVPTYNPAQFIPVRGQASRLWDQQGREYIDLAGGIAVNALGHCHPALVATLIEQGQTLWHVSNWMTNEPALRLARKLVDATFADRAFFCNSGAEANEAMIKLARKYGVETYGPHKYEIITAKESFHGRTFGSMSATGQPDNACQIGFGAMTPGFKYAEFNNLKAFEDAITENTIGIMVEPVQGEGGVHPATKEFLTGLRKLCDEKGLLLLLDEVQSGWCRTGAVMSYMNYGIKPDIVSMAKALGGGMPIAAICAREDVSKAFTMGSHGSTFGGHPVCCAAALIVTAVSPPASDNS